MAWMEEPVLDMRTTYAALSRVVAVINGKGGVGKTSITSNTAGQLGLAGQRVLVIDLDVSGNIKLDFGLVGHPGEDGGGSLVDAVWRSEPLKVITDVRPGVDVIPGGSSLEILGALTRMDSAGELLGGNVPRTFALKLAEISDNYDLILIDCPPGNKELQEMALGAARWVLIPTKTEHGSWDGLLQVGPRVKRARQDNPDLGYLGVVIFDHSPNASRLMRNTQDKLREVGETVPLFNSYIRHSETAAQDCRSRGQLAHELARDAAARATERLQALRGRRSTSVNDNVIAMPIPVPIPQALSSTADSVASDYTALAVEICARITEAEQGIPAAARTGAEQ